MALKFRKGHLGLLVRMKDSKCLMKGDSEVIKHSSFSKDQTVTGQVWQRILKQGKRRGAKKVPTILSPHFHERKFIDLHHC